MGGIKLYCLKRKFGIKALLVLLIALSTVANCFGNLPQGIFPLEKLLKQARTSLGERNHLTINAVIFDLDGTIATFNLDYKTLRAEVRGYLLNMGVPSSVLAINESIFEMLKKTELFMNHAGKTAVVEEIRVEVMGITEKFELEAASQTSLLPGAIETLKTLKKMGLKIGLCTLSSRKSTEFILNRFKVAEYFDAITPRENTSQVKPNPEHCQTSLGALKVTSTEAIFVGDSVIDIKGAKDLKVIAVGLSTGVSTKDQLVQEGANYIITSIIDLPNLVESINKGQNVSA